MYSPVLNRFTSRDPEPLEGEPDVLYGDSWVTKNVIARMNLYAYVENNPANRVDPSGLQSVGLYDDLGSSAASCECEFCGYEPPKTVPKKAEKPGCKTVTGKDSVIKKDGKAVGCMQNAEVTLELNNDTLWKSTTGYYSEPRCKGCLDVEDACKKKTTKNKEHKCFLDLMDHPEIKSRLWECRCLNG